MDWLDVLIASLNVLPILAASEGGVTAARQASSAPTGPNSSSTSFGLEVLSSLGDVLTAVAAVAMCQPGRVMSALASCQLFAGVDLAAEQQERVALEELGAWSQGQQEQGGAGVGNDCSSLATLQVRLYVCRLQPMNASFTRTPCKLCLLVERLEDVPCIRGLGSAQQEGFQHLLHNFRVTGFNCLLSMFLQVLQEALEVPSSTYPLTRAVIHLVQGLLNQHCTWGLVPSLVSYTLNRVLAAMPWLPFSSASDRCVVLFA